MTKTVLITGASSGFGEACAYKFAAQKYNLILFARRYERLKQLKNKLSTQCAVHIAQLDIRDENQLKQSIAELPHAFYEIDILINNAGLALGSAVAYEANLDDWNIMVDTNIKGLIAMTHSVLPIMVQRNEGHIINIGSIAGSWSYPGGNVYGASKAFVQHFSRQLRADLLGKAIRVTEIDPGIANTEFSLVRFKGDKQKANNTYLKTNPLTANDVANAVYWTTSVPPHVNINVVDLMPVCQAGSTISIDSNS